MAVIWDGDADLRTQAVARQEPPGQLAFSDELALEVDELERLGLIGRGEPGGTPKRGGATLVDAGALSPSDLTLTGPGKRLYDLMDLRAMAVDTRERLLAELLVVRPPST